MSSEGCHELAQIERIALATGDLEGMRDFYRLLGATASPLSIDPDTGLRGCALDFCGVRLELFERLGRGERAVRELRSPALLHLGFVLESADAVDELTGIISAAGYLVIEPPHRAGRLSRYESVVLDPEGNELKLTV